jgi:hypothetical protein
MAELVVHCNQRIEVEPYLGGTKTTFAYKPYTLQVDIARYNVHRLTCPACGMEVQLTVFPGLPLPTAVRAGFTYHKGRFHPLVNLALLLALPLSVVLVVLSMFLEQNTPVPLRCAAGLFIVFSLGYVFSVGHDILEFMQLKCFVSTSAIHQVFLGANISAWTKSAYEMLTARLPYYK